MTTYQVDVIQNKWCIESVFFCGGTKGGVMEVGKNTVKVHGRTEGGEDGDEKYAPKNEQIQFLSLWWLMSDTVKSGCGMKMHIHALCLRDGVIYGATKHNSIHCKFSHDVTQVTFLVIILLVFFCPLTLKEYLYTWHSSENLRTWTHIQVNISIKSWGNKM